MLLVPIHLDALVLDEDKMVVEAMADFSRFPYCDGKADINPDVANISEEIVSPPFENQNLPLKAGIHLHWSLPDALTRSRHTPNGQDFPRVPNRWLVTRCNKEGIVEEEWIVESDYLYPPGVDQSGVSVTVPYRRDQPQPFRYMGRTMPLTEWLKNNSKTEDYYPKLTAVGYGEPTFAAFYPNCHSVFGFYDPGPVAEAEVRRYDVIGWYSDPTKDSFSEFIRDLPKEVTTNETRIKALEDDFKWTLKLDESQKFPQQMLCYARLTLENDTHVTINEAVAIAVGNTGTEALSAYLAHTLDGSKAIIEDQLEAIQLSAKLEHRQLDIGPKFLEARHEKGFNAIPGGSLWTVRPESTTTSAADASEADAGITLPHGIAQLLNSVNDLQQEYDQAWQEIESLRRQLFSDWYKYMLCAYPPEDARDEYPNIDEVKSYAEGNVVFLNQKIAQAGTLVPNEVNGQVIGLALPGDNGKVSTSATGDPMAATATKLAEAVNEIQKFMDRACGVGDTGPTYRLKQVSGARYWQPTEPVVLIQGAIVRASERHGQDGRSSDGLLETQVLTDTETKDIPGDQDARLKIRNRIDEIRGKSSGNFAFSTWTGQPWNPFLLEWEVEVFPVMNKSNLDPATGRYASDFIRDNFTVSENQVELSLQVDRGQTTNAANIYSGRTILTPHAGIQLTKQIETYLKEASWLLEAADVLDAKGLCSELKNGTGAVSIYFRARFAKATADLLSAYVPGEKPSEPLVTALVDELNLGLKDPKFGKSGDAQGSSTATDDLSVAELMRTNRMRLEEAYQQEIAQTPADLRQAYDNIRHAYDLLVGSDFQCLSQSLGGFNEALLMHKQTLQLAIGDPLGFDDYQSFATTVSEAVSSSIYSAPELLNDFNPIRSGAMKILQLRLVDTFGQIKDLTLPEEVITSEPMTNSDSEFHVRLAPRLMQPARINFRWLAAESDEQEMNDHPATTPICGWLLTNNLDNSLMIYDNQGKALGSLVNKGSDAQPTWEPAPGGGADAIDKITDIKNLHLQKMVANIKSYGADFLSDFITAIDNALENIEPENFAQHQDIALLMGRPIALVRASVNLELQGLPALHQGWNEFRQDLERVTRDDNGFSDVTFPIRIGEYKQFNDGTVGYWKDNKSENYEGDVFYAPQSDDAVEIKDIHLKTHKTDPLTIFQSLKSQPHILSMLIDPRGLVHATSGILPAKAIRIPPDQYAAALQAIEITFLSTPILTDVGKIRLPLPAEAGYQWSWLQDEGGTWSEVSTTGVIQKQIVTDKFGPAAWDELKQKKWIEQIDRNIDANKASVTAKDLRSPDPLSADLADKIPELEDFLDRAHIGPVNPAAKFSGPQEIREGWLQLSPAPVTDSKANSERRREL